MGDGRAGDSARQFINFDDVHGARNVRTNFKSMLADELNSTEILADSWQITLEKYFGQPAQIYRHVLDASNISQVNWSHNDFPYEKFFPSKRRDFFLR